MSTNTSTKVQASRATKNVLPVVFMAIFILSLIAGIGVLAAVVLAPHTTLAPIQVAGIFSFVSFFAAVTIILAKK